MILLATRTPKQSTFRVLAADSDPADTLRTTGCEGRPGKKKMNSFYRIELV